MFLFGTVAALVFSSHVRAAEPQLVGASQTQLGSLSVDFWYPAERAEANLPSPLIYDIRKRLPSKEAHKIPNSANPYQLCSCYPELPLAQPGRKRPLVLMVHGTAGFSTASLTQATAYAAAGAIVLAADHPGLQLVDVLKNPLGSMMGAGHQKQDVLEILQHLRKQAQELPQVLKHVDLDRIALIGHSAGAGAIAELSQEKGVKLLVSMAGGHPSLKQEGLVSLFLAGDDDQIVRIERAQKGYHDSQAPKAFLGLSRAGHLAFTDICNMMKPEGGILHTAQKYGVRVPSIVARLGQDGCKEHQLSTHESQTITIAAVKEALRAAFERESMSIEELQDNYPSIGMVMSEAD